ncbi:MAG: GTP cyclohydrolase I [Myxococcota bacterium]|nr:GTP cyclohydrolase I [Myxococcota bacterium]
MIRKSADLDRASRAVEELLDALGVPVSSDPELAQTGRRVAEAFAHELLAGYAMDPAQILGESTGSAASGLVVVTGIATATMCPHHLLPASGVVHVGYLPGDRVVGLGALARLVDCYARRLILQEDLGQRIADALVEHLGARGAGAIVDLSQACVTARGVRQHGARAVTSAFAGSMARDAAARQEMSAAVALSLPGISRSGAADGPGAERA